MKSKRFRNHLITYGMVIGIYILSQILIATGKMSFLLQGLLVPCCVYVVLAVSLNLVVGISGELSLGHAGFMGIGAFTGTMRSMVLRWMTSTLNCVIMAMARRAAGPTVSAATGRKVYTNPSSRPQAFSVS